MASDHGALDVPVQARAHWPKRDEQRDRSPAKRSATIAAAGTRRQQAGPPTLSTGARPGIRREAYDEAQREPPRPRPASRHTCHATGCRTTVPPKMFACRRHWFTLPKALRDAIWRTYRPGQEISKTRARSTSQPPTRPLHTWRRTRHDRPRPALTTHREQELRRRAKMGCGAARTPRCSWGVPRRPVCPRRPGARLGADTTAGPSGRRWAAALGRRHPSSLAVDRCRGRVRPRGWPPRARLD